MHASSSNPRGSSFILHLATVGNVKSPRPAVWDMLGRAKWLRLSPPLCSVHILIPGQQGRMGEAQGPGPIRSQMVVR